MWLLSILTTAKCDSTTEHAHLRYHFSWAEKQLQGTMTSVLKPSRRNARRQSHWCTHTAMETAEVWAWIRVKGILQGTHTHAERNNWKQSDWGGHWKQCWHMTKLFLTSCVRQSLFTFSCRGQPRTKLLCHCENLANMFSLWMSEEMQQTYRWVWSHKYTREKCGFIAECRWSQDGRYPVRKRTAAADCYGNSECLTVCVCQKFKGHDNPGAHILTCAYASTQTQNLTSATYIYVTPSIEKLAKGKVSSCSRSTHTHTQDSILQTGQPFKQLSVTVTQGNSKTCPLSLPPQETQIHCPVKGEANELADRVPEWKGCNFTHSALTKAQHYPPLKGSGG